MENCKIERRRRRRRENETLLYKRPSIYIKKTHSFLHHVPFAIST
jgi:hypothetical protein